MLFLLCGSRGGVAGFASSARVTGAKADKFMKRKIAYADLDELNGEPIGKPGMPVKLDFLPSPEQVRRTLRTVKVTVSLAPASLDYYRRQARRRGEKPAEIMRRILQAHALAEA